jgi:4-diphosphocytidyl-2-C-methyl-D-erythritol kinase
MIEREIAPAKINLFLHVGGVRADGLHALESLFVFADDGDVVSAAPAADLSLKITGPFAAALAGFPVESNLVWRAAVALKEAAGVRSGAALTLDKRLPVASGIGGGSSDAAAALRALIRLWRVEIGEAELRKLAFSLGADVPACLEQRPVFVSGAGEIIRPGPGLPPLWACLVNPRVEIATGPIFAAFDRRHPAPPPPARAAATLLASYGALQDYLKKTGNSLEAIACERESIVAVVRSFIAGCPGCLLARMSGSGATLFGLFASHEAARRAAQRSAGQGWWSMAVGVRDCRSAVSSGERQHHE